MPDSADAQVGSCAVGVAESRLSANNVSAAQVNTGALFYRTGGNTNRYEIPRGSGLQSVFTGNLWLGGYVASRLRVAGTKYFQPEFWPGPVSDAVSPTGCDPNDRMYRVAKRDINAFNAGEQPSQDLLEWPWHQGAPVVDGDGIPDNYDLADGDRPEILGEETVFWIMNDVGNVHTRSGSAPLGVEVHVSAFAAASANTDIDNTTFYRYRVYNRNALPIEDMAMGLFMDVDLGSPFDDYVGSDPPLNLAYSYNGDNDDEVGYPGYGVAPPAVGFQVLGGSVVDTDGLDNDNDGSVDEPGEQLGLFSFLSYDNLTPASATPTTGEQLYNNMRGIWRDGTEVTEGGAGYTNPSPVVKHMYTGNVPSFWSEYDTDGIGTASLLDDRRSALGVGSTTLLPGEYMEVFVAVIWARGDDNIDSVNDLKAIAGRLAGTNPEDITGNSTPSVVETPVTNAPFDGADDQPLDVTLEWGLSGSTEFEFEVQVSDNDGFLNATSFMTEASSLSLAGQIVDNTEYVWRVRAFNTASYSAWSPVSTFYTGTVSLLDQTIFDGFSVLANASGPLVPPAGGAADFADFPGTVSPDASQQTNGSRWLIHTGGNGADRISYDAFVNRVVRAGQNDPTPYDYEIRFTGTSLHFDRFGFVTGGINVADPLPFELWNTGINTPGDPSDDYRMIAVGLDLEGDGWGLRNVDHEVSGGDNDPETDWIYFMEPADKTPGTSGYDTWALTAETDPTIGLGGEVLARIVMVNWNGGSVSGTPVPVYNAVLPESGTVFRIETSEIPGPILASPAKDGYAVPGNVAFSWTSATAGSDILVVATDPGLTLVEASLQNVVSGTTVALAPGTYYWSIIGLAGGSSEVWSFEVKNLESNTLNLVAGWNLVGVPFSSPDMTTGSIFAGAVEGSVKRYSGKYSPPALGQVQAGHGYWVEYTASWEESNDVFLTNQVNVFLEPGWNLISGPACSLSSLLVLGDAGVIAPGTQFAYASGSYAPSSIFDAGSGYWLFADSAGMIILDCDEIVPGKMLAEGADLLAGFDAFSIRSADDMPQKMYLGGSLSSDLSPNAFRLPPNAPGQLWRPEFKDGRYVSAAMNAVVDIRGATLPLVVNRLSGQPEDGLQVVVSDESGQRVGEYVLEGGESIEINSVNAAEIEFTVLVGISVGTESLETPDEFELGQNYPNPFNPETNIRFALPKTEAVSLVVMDVNGRVVATLISNEQMNAGWHSVSFNASHLASGAYYYQVSTPTGTRVRSMILLK